MAVFVYYITKYINIQDVLEGHIIYAYKATRQKPPKHLYQLFLDTKNGPGYVLSGRASRSVRLSGIGENFVEFNLPTKKKINAHA